MNKDLLKHLWVRNLEQKTETPRWWEKNATDLYFLLVVVAFAIGIGWGYWIIPVIVKFLKVS